MPCYVSYWYEFAAIYSRFWNIIFLNFGYYHPDDQYLRKQECDDPWLLFAPKGACEQKRLENSATMHTLLAPMLKGEYNCTVIER